ncbi:MAG: hypothetical protein AABW99_03125 [archaeon]
MAQKEKENKEVASKEKTKQQPKARKKTVDKWKKKAWYTILAPKEFEFRELGETISEKPETLIGRTITVTGRELANQPKKQHIHLKFRVVEVKASKANTIVTGHVIKDNFLRRIIRRHASKIMSIADYSSKDGQKFRIKIAAVTDRRASRAQKTAIRKRLTEETTKIILETDSNKVVDEVVFGNITNSLYAAAKKIVPLKRIEIVGSELL